MFKLNLEKAEEPEQEEPSKSSLGFLDQEKKQESSRKASNSASLTMLKTVWIPRKCGKFLNKWEYQTTLPVS